MSEVSVFYTEVTLAEVSNQFIVQSMRLISMSNKLSKLNRILSIYST